LRYEEFSILLKELVADPHPLIAGTAAFAYSEIFKKL
jgi:hypothetical protein